MDLVQILVVNKLHNLSRLRLRLKYFYIFGNLSWILIEALKSSFKGKKCKIQSDYFLDPWLIKIHISEQI